MLAEIHEILGVVAVMARSKVSRRLWPAATPGFRVLAGIYEVRE